MRVSSHLSSAAQTVTAGFLILLVLVAPSRASAQQGAAVPPPVSVAVEAQPREVARSLDSRLFGLRFDLGVGSPIGIVGVAALWNAAQAFELELGLGFGGSGFQLSLLPKLALGRQHRFTIGAGPSLGLGEWYVNDNNGVQHHGTALWLNAELGYELRTLNGWTIFLGLGFTYLLGTSSPEQRDGFLAGTRYTGLILPMARIGFGYFF